MAVKEATVALQELGQIGAMTEKNFSWRTFLRHFFEMFLAMAVGMVLLDEVAWVMFSLFAHIDLFAIPILYAPVMAIDMTIGMAFWMPFRRHTLRNIWEMSGAMVLPVCLLIGPHWVGLLSGDVLLGGSMILSLPSMIFIMFYRRDVYGQGHNHHSSDHHHVHTAS